MLDGSYEGTKEITDDMGKVLRELGTRDYKNLNVSHGQTSQFIDSNFAMKDGTSDIGRGDLRRFEVRKLNNIKGDYHVPERFKERVALHIAKNYLVDQVPGIPRVPLLLGIWGGKGEGKSFLTELCLKQLKVEPIVMSAGELEDEVAGAPARLIRQRYRKAADMSKVRGKLSCIVINDIDAGVGTYAETQNTVNTQMIVGTLMNICDDPTRVSIGAAYKMNDVIRRIPIIITANDLSTIYAPLLRDGRMDKFFWKPSFEDRLEMVWTMFKEDEGVTIDEMAHVLKTFEHQSLDFFGALRARLVDNSIKRIMDQKESAKSYLGSLLKGEGTDISDIEIEISLERLLEEGMDLVQEQEHMKQIRLVNDYMPAMNLDGGGPGIGLMG